MVRAWYLNPDLETDQSRILNSKELKETTGVLCWKLNPETYEEDGTLDAIRTERGYRYQDVIDISPETLPDYEEKVREFHTEHLHEEEELRFALKGSAYFDVRSYSDEWIRIEVLAGIMITLPPGIYHRHILIEHQSIKLLRCFISRPVWSSRNRETETENLILDNRRKYLEAHSSSPAN